MTKRKPRCQCCGLYERTFLQIFHDGTVQCFNCLQGWLEKGVCPHQTKREAREQKVQVDPRQITFFEGERVTETGPTGDPGPPVPTWVSPTVYIAEPGTLTHTPEDSTYTPGRVRIETDEERAVREADSWEVAAFEGDLERLAEEA